MAITGRFSGGGGSGFSPIPRPLPGSGASAADSVTPIPFDDEEANVQSLLRRYDSQAQVGGDLAARTAQQAATSARAALDTLDPSKISREEYNTLAEIAETGYKAEKPNFIFGLLDKFDRAVGTIRLGVLDVSNADTAKGKEIEGGDYWDMLLGRKAALRERLGTDLIGEDARASGSSLLTNVFDWEPDDREGITGEKIGRGAADFLLETLLDPTTYLTFGLSAVGKKAGLEAAQAASIRYARRAIASDAVEELASPLLRGLRTQYDDLVEEIMDKGRRELAEQFDPSDMADELIELAERAKIEAAQTVESDLVNAVGQSLASRDFKSLPDDWIKEVIADPEAPNWLAGGARVILPRALGGAGVQGGVTIPGSRGAGRAVTNALFRDRKWFDMVAQSPVGDALRGLKRRLGSEQAQLVAARAGELYEFNRAARSFAELMQETGLREVTVNLGAEAHRLSRIAKDAGEDSETVLKQLVEYIESGDVPLGRAFKTAELDEAARTFVQASIDTMGTIYDTMKRYDPTIGDVANYVPRIMSDDGLRVMKKLAEAAPEINTSTRGGQLLSVYLRNFAVQGKAGARSMGESVFQQTREIGRSAMVPAVADTRYALLDPKLIDEFQTGSFLPLNAINSDLTEAIEDTITRNGLSLKWNPDQAVFDDDPLNLLTRYYQGMMGALEQRVMVSEWRKVGLIRDSDRAVDLQRTMETVVEKFFLEADKAGETGISRLKGWMADIEARLDDQAQQIIGTKQVTSQTVDLGHGMSMSLPEGIAELEEMRDVISRAKDKVAKAMARQDEILAGRQVQVNDLIAAGVSEELAVDIAMAQPDELTELLDEMWDQALRAKGPEVRAMAETLAYEAGSGRADLAAKLQASIDNARQIRREVKEQRRLMQAEWRKRQTEGLRYVNSDRPYATLSAEDMGQLADVIRARAESMADKWADGVFERYGIDAAEARRRIDDLRTEMDSVEFQEWILNRTDPTVRSDDVMREIEGVTEFTSEAARKAEELRLWVEGQVVDAQAVEARQWVEEVFQQAVQDGFPVERLPSTSTLYRLQEKSGGRHEKLAQALGEITYWAEHGELPSAKRMLELGHLDFDDAAAMLETVKRARTKAKDPELLDWLTEQSKGITDVGKFSVENKAAAIEAARDAYLRMLGSEKLSIRRVAVDEILSEIYDTTNQFGTSMQRMLAALRSGDRTLLRTPSVQDDILSAIEMLGGDPTTFEFVDGTLRRLNPQVVAEFPSVAEVRKAMDDAGIDTVAEAMQRMDKLPVRIQRALEADGVPQHINTHMNLTRLSAEARRAERGGAKLSAEIARLDEARELFESKFLPRLRKVMAGEAKASTLRRNLMTIEDGRRVLTDQGKILAEGLPGDVFDEFSHTIQYFEALESTRVDRRLLHANRAMLQGRVFQPMHAQIRKALEFGNDLQRRLTVAEGAKLGEQIADAEQFLDVLMDGLLTQVQRKGGAGAIFPYERLFASNADLLNLGRMRKLSKRLGIDAEIFTPSETMRSTTGYRPVMDAGVGGEVLSGGVARESVNLALENLASNLEQAWTPAGVEQLKSNMTTFLNGYWKGSATVARPTFHLRNAVGAVWNNQIADVGVREYIALGGYPTKFLNSLRNYQSIDEAMAVLPERLQPAFRWMLNEGIFDTTFAREFRKVSAGRHIKLTPFGAAEDLQDWVPFRAGGVAMESIEAQARAAVFYRYFDPKNPAESAALAKQMVHAVHFDYSDLTQLERSIKRFVPFFVWTRRNIPLQLQTLLERPGIAMRYQHLAAAVENQWGSTEADLFPTSQYQTGWVAETGIVMNEDTPFWARILFDPDIPMKGILETDPLSWESWTNLLLSSLGPQFTTILNVRDQSEYPEVNAPNAFVPILKGLNTLGLFDDPTAAGDYRIGRGARTVLETAIPFYREYEELTVGSNDPQRQAKLGQLEDENNWLERVALTLGKGLGVQTQIPQDSYGQFYGAGSEVTDIVRDAKLGGQNLETDESSAQIVERILASLSDGPQD